MAVDSRNILDALKSGRFDGVPSYLLARRFLALPELSVGQSYLHLAAMHGTLHKIPGLLLDRQLLTLRDKSGRTVLHIAGLNRTLHHIPLDLLYDSDFRITDSIGRTVYKIARDAGCSSELLEKVSKKQEPENCTSPASGRFQPSSPPLNQHKVPIMRPSIVTTGKSISRQRDSPNQRTVRLVAFIDGNAPLPDDLTKDDLSAPLAGDPQATTPLHIAAGKGKLGRFPSDLLTDDLMMVRDMNGRTPLHRAASRKMFDRVPKCLLTPRALSARDLAGVLVFDEVVRIGMSGLIPASVISKLPEYSETVLEKEIESENFGAKVFKNTVILSSRPSSDRTFHSWYHLLGSKGYLEALPKESVGGKVLTLTDSEGRTPLHLSVSQYGANYLPAEWITREDFLRPDHKGRTPFHDLASFVNLGDAPLGLFTKKVLLTTDKEGVSVADVAEKYGNTKYLPKRLQWLTRDSARRGLDEILLSSFSTAETFWQTHLADVIDPKEFQAIRKKFVRDWSRRHFKHALDEEQAEAVIASGCDLLVSARAGSGKTGTLVARALFEMEKRGVDPGKMVILAFNKKAAIEIRQRLAKVTGEERCPHVMTFHSLAYRLVHPEKDSILMDEKDSEEGQSLSQTLSNLIDDEIRRGELVEEIRKIMVFRWEGEWNEIVKSGGLLPLEEGLAIREGRKFHGLDGRYLGTAMEKIVADELLRRGKKYAHRPVVFQRSGILYTPAFSVLEGGRRVVIDIEGTDDPACLRAKDLFWNADRSSGAVRIELQDAERCGGIEQFRSELIASLEGDDLGWKPLSEDQIWDRIKDRAIGNFSRTVTTFIGRCQKELWTPEVLAGHISDHERELQRKKPKKDLILEACVLFWKVCHRLFIAYLDRLAKLRKTDFDHLMMDAASGIRQGKTRFRSQWNSGDLAEVEHVYVDEYQDFSHLFNALRESIQKQNPHVRFFCVGDDWQAINGFAGSNLRYFHGFSKMFPTGRKLEILKNYRSAPEIVRLGNWVMASFGSPSEPARDIKGRVCQIFAGSGEANGDWEECVEDQLGARAVPLLKLISRSMQEGMELLVLFRNRTVWTSSQSLSLSEYRKMLLSWLEEDPKERLIFSTTHSYKGGEAGHVILADPEDYPLLHEDHIFNRIFGETAESLIEDERRLFYVGVTRTKEQLVFLRDKKTRIMQGRPVLIDIPFLRGTPISTATLGGIDSPVFPGERCLARVSCGPNDLGAQFRQAQFVYREDKKTWIRLIEQCVPQNRFECGEFLKAHPWLAKLDKCTVEFVWKDRREVFAQGVLATSIGKPAIDKSIIDVQSKPIPGWTGETTPEWVPARSSAKPASEAQKAQFSRRHPSAGVGPAALSGVFNTSVVGMKYGRMDRAALLNTGDFVQLAREPSNSHDHNAIRVNAPCGAKIGYLSRHVAAHLAKGLDAWGGVSQAKITSAWKQPPPHTSVSIEICFPLPPGVVIPAELDRVAQMEDNPFDSPRKPQQVSSTVMQQAPSPADSIPTHQDGSPDSATQNRSALSAAEREELELIADVHLRDLIATLAIEQSIPFPTVGFDGGTGDVADGSMLEVAWEDYKIGIAIPENQIGSFERRQWTIFHAETLTPNDLRQAFGTSTDFSDDVSPSIDLDEEFKKFENHHRSGTASEIDDEPDDDIPF